MIVDMHLHLRKRSPCSIMTLESLANNLSNKIDAICITDHNILDPIKGLNELSFDFRILYGTEITTSVGDILVYGIEHLPRQIVSDMNNYMFNFYDPETIIDFVHRNGGIAVFAHPSRTLILENKAYKFNFDAIELNGSCFKDGIEMAKRIATVMDLPTIGGSDAHMSHDLNTYATRFEEPIETIQDIVRLVKNGQCKAIRI